MSRLSDTDIESALRDLEDWGREGDQLVRQFVFGDFVAALGFIVQVGTLAERANHHPTLTNTYNRVHIALSTHDEGGITERDVALAREISDRTTP